jgi:hypothetical protein
MRRAPYRLVQLGFALAVSCGRRSSVTLPEHLVAGLVSMAGYRVGRIVSSCVGSHLGW